MREKKAVEYIFEAVCNFELYWFVYWEFPDKVGALLVGSILYYWFQEAVADTIVDITVDGVNAAAILALVCMMTAGKVNYIVSGEISSVDSKTEVGVGLMEDYSSVLRLDSCFFAVVSKTVDWVDFAIFGATIYRNFSPVFLL